MAQAREKRLEALLRLRLRVPTPSSSRAGPGPAAGAASGRRGRREVGASGPRDRGSVGGVLRGPGDESPPRARRSGWGPGLWASTPGPTPLRGRRGRADHSSLLRREPLLKILLAPDGGHGERRVRRGRGAGETSTECGGLTGGPEFPSIAARGPPRGREAGSVVVDNTGEGKGPEIPRGSEGRGRDTGKGNVNRTYADRSGVRTCLTSTPSNSGGRVGIHSGPCFVPRPRGAARERPRRGSRR